VDEDDVSGYKKTVTGYNIINTLNSLAGSEEDKYTFPFPSLARRNTKTAAPLQERP
jgi:hypothetical protein